MQLAELLRRYWAELEGKHALELLPEQRRAAECILKRHTEACGQTLLSCPWCGAEHAHSHSCAHRACPSCQNHSSTKWLQRQNAKLLPVRYYLLTLTVPAQFRGTVYRHQRLLYEASFQSVTETIRDVAGNARYLGAEPGMTTVLHTHSRSLQYHPHIHVILPVGGVGRSYIHFVNRYQAMRRAAERRPSGLRNDTLNEAAAGGASTGCGYGDFDSISAGRDRGLEGW